MEENKKLETELNNVSGGSTEAAGAGRVHPHEGEECGVCNWGKLRYLRDQEVFGKRQEVYICNTCNEYEVFDIKE